MYGSREVEAGLSWTQKVRAYNGVKLKGRISEKILYEIEVNNIYKKIRSKKYSEKYESKCIYTVKRFYKNIRH